MSGMGGLNVRAEKLYAMMIWALIIDKNVMFPGSKRPEQTASSSKNCNIPCCGKVLRALSTKSVCESNRWLRVKRRYSKKGKDWIIRIFTKFKLRVSETERVWALLALKIQSLT